MKIFSVTAVLVCCLCFSNGSVLKSNWLQESLYNNGTDDGSGEAEPTTTEVTTTVEATTEHPRDAETVTLDLANMTITEFNETLQESFKKSIAKHLTTYCTETNSCGGTSPAEFFEINVQPVADDNLIWNSVKEELHEYQPKQQDSNSSASPVITKDDVNITSYTKEGHGVRVEFHVELNTPSGKPFVIPQETVEETVNKYTKEIATDTGLEVTVVPDPVVTTTTEASVLTTPTPDDSGLEDWEIALIGASCGVFVIIVLACCCCKRNKSKESDYVDNDAEYHDIPMNPGHQQPLSAYDNTYDNAGYGHSSRDMYQHSRTSSEGGSINLEKTQF